MRDIKDLPQKDKIDLLLACEDFYPKARKLRGFNETHKLLKKELSLGSGFDNELWCVINSVTKALRYKRSGSQMPLGKNTYLESNRMFKGHMKLSHAKMINLLKTLEEKNYIEIFKGHNNTVEAIHSRVLYKDKILNLFDVETVKKYGLERSLDEYVIVKDYTTDVLVKDKSRLRGIDLIRKDMKSYNEFLSDQEIIIDGVVRNVCYKRVFADDVDGAGRFYTLDGFLNLAKELRSEMVINSEPTTEVDLCNLHPRIYYTLKGVKVDDDFEPYYVCPVKYGVKDLIKWRSFCKLGLLCVLYAKKRNSATNALRDKLGKIEEYKGLVKSVDCKKIIQDLIDRNKKISDYFFNKDGWKYLQNIDSRIVSHVVKKFTEDKEVCLPYHDSFVVTVNNRDRLRNYMEQAWKSVLGTNLNFKCEVEF